MSDGPVDLEERLAPPRAGRASRPLRGRSRIAGALLKGELYPLQARLVIFGVIAAALAMAFQDWAIALAVFALFTMVGITWRVDMVPFIPACLAYQWVSACAGYIYLQNVGYLPGGLYADEARLAMLVSLMGLGALALGLRLSFQLFQKLIVAKATEEASIYDIRRLFTLTLIAFAASYAVDIAPKAIWLGGAQIIETLLALRFVPFFMLLVAVFDTKRGYRYLALATAWVILPELLTGFSGFKEILIVVLIAILARWRPWIKTRRQAQENRRLLLMGVVGGAALMVIGLVWNGGIKQEWRDRIWTGTISTSPIERMAMFFEVAGSVLTRLDVERAADLFVGRVSSGEIFFAHVLERVPETVPHENGMLLGKAVSNAVMPRFLFPDKTNLGGDSWLVRRYAGLGVSGDESGTSVGLGYMAEFYIDFGLVGVVALSFLWGGAGGVATALLAKVSPSRWVFLALIIGVFTQYYMSFDGSFIKLLAGFIQRVAVAAVLIAMFGAPLDRWLRGTRRVQWRPIHGRGGRIYEPGPRAPNED